MFCFFSYNLFLDCGRLFSLFNILLRLFMINKILLDSFFESLGLWRINISNRLKFIIYIV